MKLKKDNILIIGDTHLPFEHPDYLDFCVETQKKFKCGTVVHIGDIADYHSISYHEHDPNGMSPKEEWETARKHLKNWFKAFPKVKHCFGNHDRLVDRKGKTAGLPNEFFKPFREIWGLPSGWESSFHFIINNVKYVHGTNCSGKYPHLNLAVNNRMNTVMGHVHSVAGVEWNANELDKIFGLSVGCGINRRTYAFAYGKDFKNKPLLGCGVVLDRNKYPQFIPMDLKSKIKILRKPK